MSVEAPRVCALVPTYDNPGTLEKVVREIRVHIQDVLVVDDGSGPAARAVAESLEAQGLARVRYRKENGGKGAAVTTGFAFAKELGFTHVIQLDADGQHNVEDIPRFLAAVHENPDALVLGQPVFDESAPRNRRFARKISVFWCMVETLSTRIGDPLCGYRAYPLSRVLRVGARGRMMDFDPEIAVRLVWDGAPVTHISTRVRYFSKAEGGVSHYRGFEDTFRISLMHSRLCLIGIARIVTWPVRKLLA